MTPQEAKRLASVLANAAYDLRDYRELWQRISSMDHRQALRSGDPKIRTEAEAYAGMLRDQEAAYNQKVPELRRLLEEVRVSPVATLFREHEAHQVDVLEEATVFEKWEWQALSQASAKLSQATGAWDEIAKDPSRYPMKPIVAPQPAELAELRADIDKLRADVDALKKRNPWTREQKIAAASVVVAALGLPLGASIIRGCKNETPHESPPPAREERPSKKPATPDGSISAAASVSAVGQSTTPPAPSADHSR